MHRIRELRDELKVSQAKLAVQADMNPATLNRIEQGKGNPNLRTLEKLADVLGVPVAELVKGDSLKKAAAPPSPKQADGASGEERRTNVPELLGVLANAMDLLAAQADVSATVVADHKVDLNAAARLVAAAAQVEGRLSALLGDDSTVGQFADVGRHIANLQSKLEAVPEAYEKRTADEIHADTKLAAAMREVEEQFVGQPSRASAARTR
jgi:transcriptional regulator with XRE-family HTH domain